MKEKTTFGFLRSATTRLTVTYLIIIMLMSIVFSIVIFTISDKQLRRQAPPSSAYDVWFDEYKFNNYTTPLPQRLIDRYLHNRVEEARADLAWNLVGMNLFVLILGGGVSYFLARRTLQPIEVAMRSKDQFVSDASHELRTPLTALQTTNEVALRKKKLTLPEAKQVLKDNVDEVRRLHKLSEGLLGLLKEDQVVHKQNVALTTIVSDAMAQIVSLAQEKEITVDDNVKKATVYTDQNIMVQLLTIFLDNAIKYSPEKSTITIDSDITNKTIKLHVVDQGVGIKSSDQKHIFERFYRADQSRTKQSVEGTGLGLSIASKFAEQLRVKLSVKSKVGKGSVFTITIPRA